MLIPTRTLAAYSLLNGLRSNWAANPINPTLSIMDPAWDDSGYFKFGKGWVMAKNDANFLYLALDVVDDTGDDPGTGDYFWLTFDVDENRSITSGKDVNYGTAGNPDQLVIQKYLGPGQWTGISIPPESEMRSEFGVSPKSNVPHRIWKFKIALPEIGATLNTWWGTPHTYFGFRVRSQSPGFVHDHPQNFYRDFSKLTKLIFARKPTINPSLMGPVIGSVGLIPTSPSIIKANGKATTAAGYYVKVDNAAFGGVLNLIGNRTTLTSLYNAGQARKYRVLHSPPGTGVFQPLLSSWKNYRWNGSDYELETFSADANDQYPLPNPSQDFSIDDLLAQFSTYGMDTGLHSFRIEFFKANGSTSVPSAAQTLSLYIDNNLPQVKIDSIKHGANEVSACAIEKIGPAPDGITFNITAHDPEGNLRALDFRANYGENQTQPIYAENYASAVPPGADWNGVQNFPVPTNPSPWRPPQQCAYSFLIRAWARTTNGYSYIGKTSYYRTLTLLV